MTLTNRSIWLKILVFCMLIGVSAVALRPIQSAISFGMYEVRNNFILNIEEATGFNIRYASIRPSIFGSFEIRNVKLLNSGRSFFSMSKISVRFSWLKLIMGDKTENNSLQAIHTIYIEKPYLNLDMQIDQELIEFFFGAYDLNINQIIRFLPQKVNYKIQDFSVILKDKDFVYVIDNMNMEMRSENQNILLDSKFNSEIRYSGVKDKSFFLNMDIDIKGSANHDLINSLDSDIHLEIILSSISCFEQNKVKQTSGITYLFSIHPVKAGIGLKDSLISINNSSNDSSNFQYAFKYNIESKEADVNIVFDEYRLGSGIVLGDYLKDLVHLLDLIFNGCFIFSKDSEGLINYNIDLLALNHLENADRIIINAQGDNEKVQIDELSLNASLNTVNAGLFSGKASASGSFEYAPFSPDANIIFSNFSLTGKEGVNADFKLKEINNAIELSAENILAGEVKISDFIVSLYPYEDDMEIYASFNFGDGAYVFADAFYSKKQYEAIFNIENFPLLSITGILRPFFSFPQMPSFAANQIKDVFIDTQVFISSDFNNFIYNLPDILIKNKSGSKDHVIANLSLSGTDRQFNLSRGAVYLENNDILFSSKADFNNQSYINFNLYASYKDTYWNLDGQILDGNTLIIRDPNGFHAYGSVSNTGAVSCFIEGADYPIIIDDNHGYLNFYTSLRYNDIEFWACDVSYFSIQQLTSQNQGEIFRISGSLDQDGASFREIIYTDSTNTLFGNADFSYDPDFSYLQFYINMTDGIENGEYYNFEGMLRNSHITASSNISNMNIHRFIKSRSEMTLSAQIKIAYDSINDFSADINVTSLNSKIQNNDLNVSGGISFTNDELAAKNINIEFAGINTSLPSLQVKRDEGFASFNASVEGLIIEKIFDTNCEFTANFNIIDSWLDIANVFDFFEGKLVINNFLFGDIQYENTEFVFSGIERAVSLSGGINEMLRLDMDNEGNFYLGLSSPLPIRGSLAGTLKDFMLDAHCNNVFIDLPVLVAIATPSDSDFYFDGGYITGKIDIKGHVLNPEFFGAAKGSSFRINVPNYIPESIRTVPFNVAIEGYEMSFGPVVTVCGAGGGLTNGWLRFENWIPKNIGIYLDVPRDTPIPYNVEIAGFQAHGDAYGKLNLLASIDDFLMEISGDLAADNTEMSIYELKDENIEDPKINTIVDLQITTGPMVEFFWPNANNPLLRVNPEMGTKINITADSESQSFSIKSQINVRSGELYYFDRNFQFKQGNLVLNENEREFNPILSARAEIRERLDSGPVTIALIIENQPLLSFEPRFTATPSLTQLEIYSLLGQNVNTQGYDNPESAQAFLVSSTTEIIGQVVARSDALGQLIFLRQLERQVRDFLYLDMLSFRTRFIQNAIAYNMTGAAIAGETGSADTVRVGNYLDNTTVSIGKYVGQDMFIQGTATMKYNENNANMGGISLEYDIGIEWRSPFVNIRWSFIPATPQNWFVNDNSLTLSWSKTF